MEELILKDGRMNDDTLSKLDELAMWVYHSPALLGVIGAMGGVAQMLLSGDPICKRRIVGSVLMALFIGCPSFFLMVGLGVPEKLAHPIAIVLSSMGDNSYQLLTQRAIQIFKGGNDGNLR